MAAAPIAPAGGGCHVICKARTRPRPHACLCGFRGPENTFAGQRREFQGALCNCWGRGRRGAPRSAAPRPARCYGAEGSIGEGGPPKRLGCSGHAWAVHRSPARSAAASRHRAAAMRRAARAAAVRRRFWCLGSHPCTTEAVKRREGTHQVLAGPAPAGLRGLPRSASFETTRTPRGRRRLRARSGVWRSESGARQPLPPHLDRPPSCQLHPNLIRHGSHAAKPRAWPPALEFALGSLSAASPTFAYCARAVHLRSVCPRPSNFATQACCPHMLGHHQASLKRP